MRIIDRLATLIVVACFLSLMPGCKDEEARTPNAAPPAPAAEAPRASAAGEARPAGTQAATSAHAPATPEAVDVPALLRAGGAHWSATPEGEPAEPGASAAGSDYWIWPAEDVVYVPERGANAVLSVRLNWRLRPGGKPAGEALYGMIASAAQPGAAALNLRNVAEGFDGRAEGGVVEVRFAPWKASAAGDVTLFASKPGSSSAVSNVLRLKVAPPPPPAAEKAGGSSSDR